MPTQVEGVDGVSGLGEPLRHVLVAAAVLRVAMHENDCRFRCAAAPGLLVKRQAIGRLG